MRVHFLFLVVLGAFFLFQGATQGFTEEKSAGTSAEDQAKAEEAKKKAEAIDEINKNQPEAIYQLQKTAEGINPATVKGDSAWVLISTALVMLMVPGLALFYCGMVRRKNVLATMMHSMVALAIVGVYWLAIGYALAFGDPWLKIGGKGIIGFSWELLFLKGVNPTTLLPNTNIPVYLHMLFQGMFAIITPALISGALAERIRFAPYCVFLIVWTTFVYCPLAHWVWAMNWDWANTLLATPDAARLALAGKNMVGYLGAMEALDFAGGTVVHIAAGFSSLAAILVLRKRLGYPQHAIHPNSMVLTLTGAGLLWFGWFGFNGGSALGSGELATSAFAATQMAAAGAGLSWMLVEWWHRGKPTALGLASGIVAGLVAVTPASGFIFPWSGLVIGLLAGVVCYISVNLKPFFKYDDSLDAFGVHGVGGFLGAVLTGFFCSQTVNSAGFNSFFLGGAGKGPNPAQVVIQLFAAIVSAAVAFGFSLIIVKIIDNLLGFVTDEKSEIEGLDRTEHEESGFDFGPAGEALTLGFSAEPRSALVPPVREKRFQVVVEGPNPDKLLQVWTDLCQPNHKILPEFKVVYPHMTTVQGNRFQFSGGDQNLMCENLQHLFQDKLQTAVKAHVE